MPWLLPSLIATLGCTSVFSALYAALYLRHRQAYLGLWSACWLAFSLTLAAFIFRLTWGHQLLVIIGQNLLAVTSIWFLWLGVVRFLDRPHYWPFSVAALILAAIIPPGLWWPATAPLVVTICFFFMGFLQIVAGWLLWRSEPEASWAQKLTGLGLIFWGLHRADYPFVKNIDWLAPWGYLLALMLTLWVALGMVVIFFERLRRELIQAQGAAQSSLDLLNIILETAPVGVALASDRRIVWVNRAFQDFAGHDPQQWIGRETRGLYPDDEEFERVGRLITSQLASAGWAEVETNVVRADGSVMPALLRMRVIDGQNPMAGYVVTISDIGALKIVQEELARATRIMRAIGACHHALLHATQESALMEEVCQVICEQGGYRMAWVGMLDAQGRVVPMAKWGFEDGYLDQVAISIAGEDILGRGPLGTALRTGSASVAQNILLDSIFEPWRTEAVKRGYAAVAGLPLMAEGRPFGVLGIYAAQADAFPRGELELLSDLAKDLAFGVGVLRAGQAQRQAESDLAASEDRYRRFVQTSMEGIWSADENYVTTYVNPRLTTMLGYAENELIGKPITSFMPDDEMDDHQAKAQMRRRAISQQYVRRFKRKQGGHIWALVSAAPVLGPGGEFLGSFAMLSDISDRVAAEKALRFSEERYRQLVESANEGIVVAQDGMIKFFNSRMLEITGFLAQEYMDMPFIEHVHPDDRQRVLERHRRRLEGDRNLNTEPFRIIDSQGRTKWLRPNGVFIEWEGRPATLGFFTDITESRQTEEALRASDERYRLLSDNTQDVVCLHAQDLRILYVSPSVTKALGFSPGEVQGESVLALLHPDDAHKVSSLLSAVNREEGEVLLKNENRLRTKGGDYLWMETLATVVRGEDGGIKFIQTTSRDISERKRAEDALKQLAAGVAHNFNNVLMAILSNAQFAQALIAQESQDTAVLARHLNGVVQGALSGRDVVARLSRLVGPGSEWPLHLRTVEIKGLLHSLRQMLEDTWPQIHSGLVGLGVETRGDPYVAGSAGEIMEVLLNLAKNAMEAMPGGGSLSVIARAEKEQVLISVGDSGPGLAPSVEARLFEPFFSTKGVAGHGLGLAVSKAIMQAHGGDIIVSSRPEGATFTLRLPAAQPPSRTQPLPQAGPALAPLKVLLVEDEALVALGLTAILERAGHQVRHVSTLDRALDTLAAFSPQAVLCDLGLPDAQGWQVVTHIQEALQSLDRARTPVVAISGWSSRQLDPGLGESPSRVELLQKPVEAGRLLEVLARAVA